VLDEILQLPYQPASGNLAGSVRVLKTYDPLIGSAVWLDREIVPAPGALGFLVQSRLRSPIGIVVPLRF